MIVMPTQRGAYQVIESLFIDEGATFGTTPTTGTWLPVGHVHSVDAKRVPTKIRKTGIGTQLPTGFVTAKEHWEVKLEHSLVAKQTSPAFNWKDFFNMLANPSTGVPADTCKYFSLGYKLDLATDEFGWLKGCAIKDYKIAGNELADTVKGSVDIIAHSGSYGITDYVSGSATRQAKPTTELVLFGDVDIWYDTTTPTVADTILGRLNSWAFTFKREFEMRGVYASNGKLYREFAPKARSYEIELGIDFDSYAEYAHFLLDTPWYITIRIPTAVGGVQLAFTGGSWLTGEKAMRELDLIDVKLKGECTGLTESDIA